MRNLFVTCIVPKAARAAAAAAVLVWGLVPSAADGQRAVDARMGAWALPGPDPAFYSVALRRALVGPLDLSARGFALLDDAPSGRSLYGLGPELTLRPGQATPSPYAVAGTGLALERGEGTGVAAVWSAGAGVEVEPFSWLALGVEARRFVEDRRVEGFWEPDEGDRRAWQLSARLSVQWGGARSRTRPGPSSPAPGRERIVVPEGDASALRASVVETALDAMGEPYRWGGDSAEEGFDCSGLIWYAYGAHGVDLPRVSHDQARVGTSVPPDPPSLRRGDILLFGEGPDEVTHVGLYVGESRFIHSTTSGGVSIGALGAEAGANDRWWLERWVGVRRVLGRR